MRSRFNLQDRFTRGFLSGVIAGIPTFIFAIIAARLNLTTQFWADFASVFIYGHKAATLLENLLAIIVTLFFTGLMGIVFAFIISIISSGNYLLKGWVFSVTVWFFAFAVVYLFNVKPLDAIPLKTAFINFLEATIWGLVLGYALNWFDKRLKTS